MITWKDNLKPASAETVRFRSRSLGMSTPWDRILGFLARLQSFHNLRSVEIDRSQGIATIELKPSEYRVNSGPTKSNVIREIAQTLRQPVDPAAMCDSYSNLTRVKLARGNLPDGETTYVGGRIATTAQGRTRLQHPLLIGSPDLGVIVRPLLASSEEVNSVAYSPVSGTLLIDHQHSVTPEQLLVALERVLQRAGGMMIRSKSSSMVLTGTGCLALAVAATFWAPALTGVAAAALVVCNFKTLCRGARELISFRWRLPALYTVIMGSTLISGQVFAAALMQASIIGWHWWSHRRLRRHVEELLSSEHFQMINGEFPLLTESATGERPGDLGKTAAAERLSPAGDSLVASLSRLLSEQNTQLRGSEKAARFVPLSLATGAAAALTQDITSLTAVLRPDFDTGPSITERISCVVAVQRLLDRGWLLLRPEILAQVESVDTVVMIEKIAVTDDIASGHSPYLSVEHEDWDLPAAKAHVGFHRISGDPSACSAYVDQLTASGKQVAVCGSQETLEIVGHNTKLQIVLPSDSRESHNSGDVVGISNACELHEFWDTLLNRSHSANGVWPVVMASNFASILGVFAIGLTSLHVVALTNLGTLAGYLYFYRRLQSVKGRNGHAKFAQVGQADVPEPEPLVAGIKA